MAETRFREDSNKLYNYMIGLLLPQYIKTMESVQLITDVRSISVKSYQPLGPYLQSVMRTKHNSLVHVDHIPSTFDSFRELHLVDWLAHSIWKNYEDEETEYLTRMVSTVRNWTLFF